MAVQQSMSVYGQRKAETVNRLVGTMREATNLCNGYADGATQMKNEHDKFLRKM